VQSAECRAQIRAGQRTQRNATQRSGTHGGLAGWPRNKEAPYLYEGRCAEPCLASSPCLYPLLLQSPNRRLLARPGPRLPHLHRTSLLAPSPHGDLTARKRSLGQRTPPRPHSIDGSRARWATTRRLRVASWADAEGEKKAPISSPEKSQSQSHS
jgi:hypothetical protein